MRIFLCFSFFYQLLTAHFAVAILSTFFASPQNAYENLCKSAFLCRKSNASARAAQRESQPPQLSRTTRSVGKRSERGSLPGSELSNFDSSSRPASAVSWRTVVSEGRL